MKTYEDFLEDLGARESNGDYQAVNSFGYLGKYQFGYIALTDIGYYNNNGWTGKDGIWSKDDFLNSPKIQEKAIREFQEKNWEYIKSFGLDKYINENINGTRITPSALLAGYHLKGIGKNSKYCEEHKDDRDIEKYKGLRAYLESKGEIDGSDGYNTNISEYIKKFAGYKTPFDKKIGFFIWHCEEGSNTCSECAEKDGKIFQYGIDEEPPLHPNCNCYVEDIVESDIENYIDNNGNEWNMASNSISLELKHKIAAEQVSKAFSELRQLIKSYL